MKTLTFPVLTVNEFRKLALDKVIEQYADDTKEAVIASVFHNVGEGS